MPVTISDTSSAVSNSQVAATLPHLRQVVEDNVSDGTPLLSYLMGQLGVQMRENAGFSGGALPGSFVGGRDIHVPVQLLANQTVGSYQGADVIDISHQDTDRYALFPIRQNAGSLSIIGRERRANKGEAAIYNLLEGKVSRLIQDLREELTRQAVSDGTGNGGKDLTGLAAIIGTGDLAGIVVSTFPLWQPGGVASGERAGLSTAFGSFETNDGPLSMIQVFNNLSRGLDRPDALFCASNVYRIYENALTSGSNTQIGQVEYTGQLNIGNRGFKALEFKGVPMMFDFGIADGNMYFLNSRHLMFMRDSEGDFVWLTDGQVPVDQDVMTRIMVVEGNLVTNNRRMLGAITGITA